jgi:hypothetical protein
VDGNWQPCSSHESVGTINSPIEQAYTLVPPLSLYPLRQATAHSVESAKVAPAKQPFAVLLLLLSIPCEYEDRLVGSMQLAGTQIAAAWGPVKFPDEQLNVRVADPSVA